MKEVILAAGFGSRLWPLSISEAPKQFQPLIGGRSLLQNTYEVLGQGTDEHDIHVLTLRGLEHLVFEQLPDIPPKNVLVVPERRNTFPHTLFALNSIAEDDEPVLFAGVDHEFTNVAGFAEALRRLQSQDDPNTITLLCEKAKYPDTTLGYVEAAESGAVQRFIEKPSEDRLKSLMGMRSLYAFYFFYTASRTALKAAMQDMPDSALRKKAFTLLDSPSDQRSANFLDLPFTDMPRAVLQHAKNLRICAGSLGLIDVGKYATLYEINPKDTQGNVVIGDAIIDEESKKTLS